MFFFLSFLAGLIFFVAFRVLIGCLYTVRPDQRARRDEFWSGAKIDTKRRRRRR